MMILNSCYSHLGTANIPAIAELGAPVKIGEIEYIVVHIDDAKQLVYVGQKYWAGDVDMQTGLGWTYVDVGLKHCQKFYQNDIPDKYKNSDILVTLDIGYGCPVFSPTAEQLNGGFFYYNSDARRMFIAQNETAGHRWLMQMELDGDWGWVDEDGSAPATPKARVLDFQSGFRPHLAIKRKAFA